MPRKSRNNLSTNFFHIMVQGINKEYIFSKPFYKEKYLNLIYEKLNTYSISLISYCIMDNHTHLLLHSQNVNEISKFMSRINTSYAMWYNRCRARVGYVFRDRYLSEPIFNYKYLYNCIFYIHNNPVNAHLVEAPDKYQYSSYNDYSKKTGIFNSKLLDLLSLSESDYLYVLSKSNAPTTIKDDKISSISPEIVLNNYLESKNIEKEELLSNTVYLKDLITLLKMQSNLSMSEISKFIKIPRSTLYRNL